MKYHCSVGGRLGVCIGGDSFQRNRADESYITDVSGLGVNVAEWNLNAQTRAGTLGPKNPSAYGRSFD